ncbi:outer membrane beta-barrel protein [Polynucleobacter sp. MWH-CaK5]|uniref:outer membrane protein n=1 Tax=Polynucleobacter sp. MWH-CaK5 TaxID=2689107 RepID=UPI001BFED767|nr:outer membrane beta-barrel protein [Polynucleobacter sp. MWH-CaK5]QWD88895.1 outer membrane beta-barrel protein [Polynucleobacter sp. MWH-CaK5]
MKKKLLVVAASALVATSAYAQSAFEGFYGQIATGYESNSASNLGNTGTSPGNPNDNWNVSNQQFGGAPLVIGLGYNFSVAPQWLIGIGADYSALSQKSSTFSSTGEGNTLSGQTLEASNRFNIFVTPGYAIDKDKLVYLKAGYSSLTLKNSAPNYYSPSAANIASGDSAGPILNAGSQTSTVGGYVVGLGYKQIITGGIYGFAEGNYMSYSKPSFSSNLGSNGYKISSNPSVNSYQLLVGIGYKF